MIALTKCWTRLINILVHRFKQKQDRLTSAKHFYHLKEENYKEVEDDLLNSYGLLGCNNFLKIHFSFSLAFFPENVKAVNDEHGERFNQDVSTI